jgi:5-formyltetrahydrofolate cyclo-ligase
MAQENQIISCEEINKLLTEKVTGIVTYTPVRHEVNLEAHLSIPQHLATYTVPTDPKTDPFVEAAKARELFGESLVCVFIPGTKFDASGTRHGKGFGWYDRFLSALPSSWIRIGFCNTDLFSLEPLVRQSWDEPMNFVCIV